MREQKDNLIYISHIRDAIEKITTYRSMYDYDHFKDNEWDQAAIVRYFEIIGEATTRIDPAFKQSHPEIEWRDMSDFRNFLIHDYMDIDVKIVWDTMTANIPPLKKKLESILAVEKNKETS